jgi:hypothetical protein
MYLQGVSHSLLLDEVVIGDWGISGSRRCPAHWDPSQQEARISLLHYSEPLGLLLPSDSPSPCAWSPEPCTEC